MTHAFIADELNARLLEHAPNAILPNKRLDLSRGVIQEKYQEAEFDCVIASLVFLEQKEVVAFFKEVRRILSPQGFFLFSTLGSEGLYELENLGDALLKAGFELPVVDREILKLQYDHMNDLLKDLEASGLSEKWVRVTTDASDDIIAIFDVLYGYAVGTPIKTLSTGKIEILVETIKIRKPL